MREIWQFVNYFKSGKYTDNIRVAQNLEIYVTKRLLMSHILSLKVEVSKILRVKSNRITCMPWVSWSKLLLIASLNTSLLQAKLFVNPNVKDKDEYTP